MPNTYYPTSNRRLFTLSPNGCLGGVCEGLAHGLELSTVWIRLAFIFSVFVSLGSTLLIYLAMYFSFPYENEPQRNRFLGVCRRMADRLQIEVGLVRLITLFVFVSSMGVATIGYLVLHIILNEPSDS